MTRSVPIVVGLLPCVSQAQPANYNLSRYCCGRDGRHNVEWYCPYSVGAPVCVSDDYLPAICAIFVTFPPLRGYIDDCIVHITPRSVPCSVLVLILLGCPAAVASSAVAPALAESVPGSRTVVLIAALPCKWLRFHFAARVLIQQLNDNTDTLMYS